MKRNIQFMLEMTPEVAYIAGFIAGDGHISKKNTITITGC